MGCWFICFFGWCEMVEEKVGRIGRGIVREQKEKRTTRLGRKLWVLILWKVRGRVHLAWVSLAHRWFCQKGKLGLRVEKQAHFYLAYFISWALKLELYFQCYIKLPCCKCKETREDSLRNPALWYVHQLHCFSFYFVKFVCMGVQVLRRVLLYKICLIIFNVILEYFLIKVSWNGHQISSGILRFHFYCLNSTLGNCTSRYLKD